MGDVHPPSENGSNAAAAQPLQTNANAASNQGAQGIFYGPVTINTGAVPAFVPTTSATASHPNEPARVDPSALTFLPSQPGEILIVVAQFVGELSGVTVYPENYVCAYLRRHARDIAAHDLRIRVEPLGLPIESPDVACAFGIAAGAHGVIWGRFDDAGMWIALESLQGPAFGDAHLNTDWLPWLDQRGADRLGGVSPTAMLQQLPAQALALTWQSLGVFLLGRNQPEQADAVFSAALALDDTSAALHYWRGYGRYVLARLDDAFHDLDQALALQPRLLCALAQRGVVRAAQGYYSAAQHDFEAALGLLPRNSAPALRAALWSNLGQMYEQSEQLKEARDCYQRARALIDSEPMSYLQALNGVQLGGFHYHCGELQESQQAYQAALDQSRQLGMRPLEAEALAGLGIIARVQGSPSQARSYHEQALAIARSTGSPPLIGQHLIKLANACVEQQPKEALGLYDRAQRLFIGCGSLRGQAYALVGIGIAEEHRGQYTAALEAYEGACQLLQQLGAVEAERVCAHGQRLRQQMEG